MKSPILAVLVASIALVFGGISPATAEVNDAEAKALMKANKCGRCHAPNKTKSGPSLQKIAAELKDKPDAEEHIIQQITTGPKVKLKDGSEEDHTIIKTKDQAKLKNLAQWILAQ